MALAGSGRATHFERHNESILRLEREAHGLADKLPELLLDASRIAASVVHGIHGRRRPGPGETFWQFRQFQSNDAAQLIDWRRSAGSDHLFVREREWEAAHTIWLWPDLSPSMNFRSHLSTVTKRDRAVVLMLAATELLVRGGERVGLLGRTAPTASRKASTRLAEAIVAETTGLAGPLNQPPKVRLARFSGVLLFGDFLDQPATTISHIEALAGEGVTGHLVQVFDPAEETLPYEGRTEFRGLAGDQRWVADRAEALRPLYMKRLAAHRAELVAFTKRLGWSFLIHHTDRPASEPLLTLLMRLQAAGGGYRASGPGSIEPVAKGASL